MTKPGWKTTEWWTTSISQLLALLTVFGVLTPTDAHSLEESLVKIVAATFLLAANAWIVVQYIKGRVAIKMGERVPHSPRSLLPVVLLLLLPSSVSAQQPTRLLPWRADVERRLDQLERQARPAPQTPGDTEMKDLLRQLIGQLQPRQLLPIEGTPKQDLPIAGAPRQELPIASTPKQELPVPGAPRQDLPTPGTPKQDLPGQGKPMQTLPGEAKPKPAGYQRYTLYRRGW
jgi:hypothetical protein